MMVIKVGSLKIEDKDGAIFLKGSKSKPCHKYKEALQTGGENGKVENQNP